MRFNQGIYEPALLKGDLLIYCKELLRFLKANSQVIEHFSLTRFWEIEIYNTMISNQEIMSIGNAISIKMLFSHDGKGHIRYY